VRSLFRPYLMTGEDLANIGPVALLQDLAVCACLDLQGVERNGHHYFAGLSMFPEEVQRQGLAAHPDLYHPSPDLRPTLPIQDGRGGGGPGPGAPLGVVPVVPAEHFPPPGAGRRKPRKCRGAVMTPPAPPIRTTVVGSYPVPAWLAALPSRVH